MNTTYTLLVTIAHDGSAPSVDLLETMTQRGLEEGVSAATVSVIEGDHLATAPASTLQTAQLKSARQLHAAMRA
jgi:hypothetical protein